MRHLLFLLAVVALGLLQVTFLDYFRIFGIRPDLLLISAGLAGMVFELRWALIFSLFAGFFKDACAVNTFGINTSLFVLWSILIVKLTKEISIDGNLIRIVLIFIIAVIHNTIVGLILISSGNLIPLGLFLRIVFVGSIYTALVLPLVVKAIKPIYPVRDYYETRKSRDVSNGVYFYE